MIQGGIGGQSSNLCESLNFYRQMPEIGRMCVVTEGAVYAKRMTAFPVTEKNIAPAEPFGKGGGGKKSS